MSFDNLIKQFVSQNLDERLVDELIREYKEVRKQDFLGNVEETIIHSGRFSELILAFIRNYVSTKVVNIDEIHFDEILNEIYNYPKKTAEDRILTLAIPRVATSVYTIRSKKDVVHVKKIDPDFFDSSYCVAACGWMLSQLVLLFYTSNSKEANDLIDSLLEKKIPFVEEFEDGSARLLEQGMPLVDRILLVLYNFYPNRKTYDFVAGAIMSSPQYVKDQMIKLEKALLTHTNSDGAKLTKLGIEKVEKEILSKLERK
jgi:hypothetical protein